MENYIVSGLIDYDDISYDDNADLLYDLAGQVIQHFRSYLQGEKISNVLRFHQREIVRFVHVQMIEHYWEESSGYEAKISSGFSSLKESAYTTIDGKEPLNFKLSPSDKSNMSKYLFGGFSKCLYSVQKFASDAERQMAVILERESEKWFKPALGQFQIYYRSGAGEQEYQPDFVAETKDYIYMLEPKAKNQMENPEVLAKKDAAIRWCQHASDHAKTYNGKPWIYILIPHDAIADNMTLDGLRKKFK